MKLHFKCLKFDLNGVDITVTESDGKGNKNLGYLSSIETSFSQINNNNRLKKKKKPSWTADWSQQDSCTVIKGSWGLLPFKLNPSARKNPLVILCLLDLF